MTREKLIEIIRNYRGQRTPTVISELACVIMEELEAEKSKVREVLISPEILPQVVKAGTSENEYWNILKQKKGLLIFRWEEKE